MLSLVFDRGPTVGPMKTVYFRFGNKSSTNRKFFELSSGIITEPIYVGLAMSFEVGIHEKMDYRDKINVALKRRLLKPADLARLTGFSPSRISKWFGGEGKPNLYQAARIAEILEVPLSYLANDDLTTVPPDPISDRERQVLELARRYGVDWAYWQLVEAAKLVVDPSTRSVEDEAAQDQASRSTRKGKSG